MKPVTSIYYRAGQRPSGEYIINVMLLHGSYRRINAKRGYGLRCVGVCRRFKKHTEYILIPKAVEIRHSYE